MQSYKDFIVTEAQRFLKEHEPKFAADSGKTGGKSASPDFVKWCDEKNAFATWVEQATKSWGRAQYVWVEGNSRNKEPGGASKENAFASVLRDLVREVKILRKG